jgi:DNA-binding NtrC family response regulator
MAPGSKVSVCRSREGLRMPGMWQVIRSFFASGFPGRAALPPCVPVVALVLDEQDRHVLTSVSGHGLLDVHFVESCEEACAVANELTAPVILFDRDWAGSEWKTVVECLAVSPHRACVILMSSVSDDYLWQELIRRGGYDVLPKPLQADNVARLVKLAVSFWNSAPKPTAPARRS